MHPGAPPMVSFCLPFTERLHAGRMANLAGRDPPKIKDLEYLATPYIEGVELEAPRGLLQLRRIEKCASSDALMSYNARLRRAWTESSLLRPFSTFREGVWMEDGFGTC